MLRRADGGGHQAFAGSLPEGLLERGFDDQSMAHRK